MRTRCVAAALALAAGIGSPARAETNLDEGGRKLGACFVAKTNAEDRIGLIRWMFSALSASDKISDIAHASPELRDQLDRSTAALFRRLLLEDCLEIAAPLMLKDPVHTGQVAGAALGEVAMQDLLNDPKAKVAMEGFVKYLSATPAPAASKPEK